MKHTSLKAFSLIEVMISIALIALVITITISSSSFLYKALVKSEVEKLYSTCMHLQRLAMATNQRQIITFNTTANSYSYNGKEEKLSPYVMFGIQQGIKGPPSSPTKILDQPVTFAGNQIAFTPNGILQPGTIYITDKNKQYQYALSIPVSQISFLRRYYYDGSWRYLSV